MPYPKQIISGVLCLTTVAITACSSTRSESNGQSTYNDQVAWKAMQEQALLCESKLMPEDAEAIWKKAIVYFDAKNKDSDQAIEARWTLAKYYEFNGDFAKAEKLFQEILATKERFHDGQYVGLPGNISDLADCYYFQGQYKQAADLYLRALTFGGVLDAQRSQMSDRRKLANCYAKLGNNQLATTYFLLAFKRGNQSPEIVGPIDDYIVSTDLYIALEDYATMLAKAGKLAEFGKLKSQSTFLAARLISQAYSADSLLTSFNQNDQQFQSIDKKLQTAPSIAAVNQYVYRGASNAAVITCHLGKYAQAEGLYERLLELALSTPHASQTIADFSLHRLWCNCMQLVSGAEYNNSNFQIENPYLTAFRLIRNRQEYFDKKLIFTHKFAWAIPNNEALETIANYGPIIEIGAGTGYWAYLLRQMHVDVIADDITPVPSKENLWHFRAGAGWTTVIAGNESLVTKYPERTLMLCWPDGGNDLFSYNALAKYKGNHLIYIGEDRGGVTACRQFFDLLAHDWHLLKKVDIPRWPDNYDNLFVYERNS